MTSLGPELNQISSESGFWVSARADFIAHCPDEGTRFTLPLKRLYILLFSSGFHLCALYRIGRLCHRWHIPVFPLLVEKIICHWYQCYIPCEMQAGAGLWFPHPVGIVIAPNTVLGTGISIFQHVQIVGTGRASGPNRVGDGVSLGACCMITGRSIGAFASIGARAMVTHDVPADSVAVGFPAVARPADQLLRQQRRIVLEYRLGRVKNTILPGNVAGS